MKIRKLALLLTLASTFALSTAQGQENDDPVVADGVQTEGQRPEREHKRPRRENMTEEQRAAARERWQNMSEEERQAKREKMRARHGSKDRQHRHEKSEKPPRPEADAV